MKSLEKDLDLNNKFTFLCSQCGKPLDVSDNKSFYCKICKSDYCSLCIKGHNEIFLDHEVIKASDEINNDKNSLLANPDLDLDDRGINDNKLPHLTNKENEDKYSQLTMLFHETVVSLEENFNEELCKLKAKKNKEDNDNKKENEFNKNNNNIIIEESPLEFNLDQLKKLEPLERIRKIMDVINKNNKY